MDAKLLLDNLLLTNPQLSTHKPDAILRSGTGFVLFFKYELSFKLWVDVCEIAVNVFMKDCSCFSLINLKSNSYLIIFSEKQGIEVLLKSIEYSLKQPQFKEFLEPLNPAQKTIYPIIK